MTNDQLTAENADLRARLEEAEETLRAIREGEVDAVIVTGSKGDRVFALSESENLPRLMVETMNEAGLAVAPDGLLVFCNDRAAALFGHAKDQLLGRNLGELVAPADADRFGQLLQDAETSDARIEFVSASGAAVPMHVWASRLDRPEGPLVCLVATDLTRIEADRSLIARLQEQQEQLRAARVSALNLMQDAVAARREAEQAAAALQASEQRIQQALRVSHSFTFEWQTATDRVLRSDSCAVILNLAGDEARHDTGQRYFQRVHPDDRARFVQMLRELTPAANNYTTEYRVVRGDGSVGVLEEVGQAGFDAAGQIERLVGVTTDITERKRAEEGLRQSREDLDRAQAVGQIGSWRLDTRQNVLTWSDENHRLFGVPKGTPLTYEVFLGAVHPDDRQYVDTQWNAALRGEPYDLEHRIVADGQVKWVRERAYLEFDDAGQLLGGFGITQDITVRKLAEEALRASNDELTRFNEAMVGRELRMIELKQEVNDLCLRLGQPPRYGTEDDKEAAATDETRMEHG